MSDPYDMVDKIRDQELQKHKIMTTGKKEFKFASARPQPLKRSIGHGEKSSVEMEKQKEVRVFCCSFVSVYAY